MSREQARQYARAQIESYLQAKGIDTRKDFTCLSPDHADRNPSMKFDRARMQVHCFSCNKTYDIFDLIGLETGLRGRELFDRVYQLYGIEIDNSGTSGYIAPPRSAPPQPTEEAEDAVDYRYFFESAASMLRETTYLQERGISYETAESLGIGLAKGGKQDDPRLPNLPFGDWIVFPNSNTSFNARRATSTAEKGKRFFKQGRQEPFNAVALAQNDQPVFIVEGEIDALSIIEAGGQAIALCGQGSEPLLRAVKKYVPRQALIIALDNDEAGRVQEARVQQKLSELGFFALVEHPYEPHKDANEAFLASKETLQARLNELGEKAKAIAQEEQAKIKAEAQEALRRTSAREYLHDLRREIEESKTRKLVSTGMKELDKLLDGGMNTGLYILGAETSMGKTSFALQIADHMAESGIDVLYFALEMGRFELMARSLSRIVGDYVDAEDETEGLASMRDIMDGRRHASFSQAKQASIAFAFERYESYSNRIFIHEGVGNIGVEQIRQAVEEFTTTMGEPPIVFVDYLQMLAPYDIRATEKQNIDRALLELKRLSRDLGAIVIVLSSFNRQSYGNSARNSSFKESGTIEYTADILLALEFATPPQNEEERKRALKSFPREVKVTILKNRNGQTGEELLLDYYTKCNQFLPKRDQSR
jgi:Replicative DNA helicase